MTDYRNDFKGHCLTCREYDIFCKSDATVRGYRCKHHHRPMAMDESCRDNYSFASERSNLTLEDAVKWITKRGYEPKPDNSYWYVTSTICKIASLGTNSKNMCAFQELKDYYLLLYPQGLVFLNNYDINGLLLSKILLDNYLNPKTKAKTVIIVKQDLLPRLNSFTNLMIKGNIAEAFKEYSELLQHIAYLYGYQMQNFEITRENPEIIGSQRQRLLIDMV